MIYASLKTIRAWTSVWTLPGYFVLSVLSGAAILQALMQLWAVPLGGEFGWVILGLLAVAAAVKLLYWRDIDADRGDSTAESATGLGADGQVRLLEAPHSESNYLMQEMGFRIARKHAAKLRRLVLLAGFGGPFILIALGQVASGIAAALDRQPAATRLRPCGRALAVLCRGQARGHSLLRPKPCLTRGAAIIVLQMHDQ